MKKVLAFVLAFSFLFGAPLVTVETYGSTPSVSELQSQIEALQEW